jgi:hypothetical protein
MTNVTHLFPDQERLNSQDALRSAIRQQLAACVGTFQRQSITDDDILFSLHRMEDAANLIRALYDLKEATRRV